MTETGNGARTVTVNIGIENKFWSLSSVINMSIIVNTVVDSGCLRGRGENNIKCTSCGGPTVGQQHAESGDAFMMKQFQTRPRLNFLLCYSMLYLLQYLLQLIIIRINNYLTT